MLISKVVDRVKGNYPCQNLMFLYILSIGFCCFCPVIVDLASYLTRRHFKYQDCGFSGFSQTRQLLVMLNTPLLELCPAEPRTNTPCHIWGTRNQVGLPQPDWLDMRAPWPLRAGYLSCVSSPNPPSTLHPVLSVLTITFGDTESIISWVAEKEAQINGMQDKQNIWVNPLVLFNSISSKKPGGGSLHFRYQICYCPPILTCLYSYSSTADGAT